jgi:phosphosulfolactate synthase
MNRESIPRYLHALGVADLAPATCPFDPGVAPVTLESHLEQSAHLILSLKISMACWMVADPAATRRKLDAARTWGVETGAGGGPFEIAAAQGCIEEYLELCAGVGFDTVECGSGFTELNLAPGEVAAMTQARGLAFEYELGRKHSGKFAADIVEALAREGNLWLEAGARRLIVEARESAEAVGLFDSAGRLDHRLAERLAETFGLDSLVFEAPTKASQFAFIDQFGPTVQLANVPLAELLRVEIYRRGLHSDAFANPKLRPARAAAIPR